MSYSRDFYTAVMMKLSEWGLLSEDNIAILQQRNDIDLLSKVMHSLIEVWPDMVLDQNDFEILMRHVHLDKIHKVLLELKKANITLDKYNFTSIVGADPQRLSAIIIFLKHSSLFNEVTQQKFDEFIQRNFTISAKQLINLYNSAYCVSKNINLERLADFFIELELSFSYFTMQEISDALYEHILDFKIKSKNKIELLLNVENETDPNLFFDLMSVIKMRIKVCLDKGNALLVMPEKIVRAIIEAGNNISHIDQLSFLHHHVHELEDLMDLSYQEKVGLYSVHMPDLKHIVLRSCSTVEPDFDNYKLKLLKSSQDILAIQVQATTLLIQQKEENNEITTFIKYKKHGLKESRVLTSIPLHRKNNFSASELEEISSYCDVTLEQKPSPIKKDPALIKKFYNGEFMTQEEIQLVKKMIIRARTETRNDFGNKPCMANTMMHHLMKANYCGTLKGYIKGYKIMADRVLPVNGVAGVDAFPKAVRVKINGHLSKEQKSQPTFECVSNTLMKFADSIRYTLFSPVETNPCTVVSRIYPMKSAKKHKVSW